jgi:hypothetical protein
MKLTSRFFIAMLFLQWSIACDNHDLGPVMKEVSCEGVDIMSYADDIEPIVIAICAECHNSADFPTRDWTDKELFAQYAVEASRRVRLFVTDPEHMPKNGELSDEQIQKIVCWASQGAPTDN